MTVYDISQNALEMATWRWGKPVRYYDVCDSTNARAAEWARAGAPDGSLVVADHQTEGRGRGDRTWFSLPHLGSLLFSVILHPKVRPEQLGLVTMATAVSTSLALSERKQANKLKWPNDIVTRGRKLGGLLAEAEISGGKVSWVVVGVGVNMRITRDQFPRELQATATSCVVETGRSYDRAEVLAGILIHLDPAMKDLAAGRTATILNQYQRLCDTIGKAVSVDLGNRNVKKGVAVGVDELGGLILDTGEVISMGDVTHLD
ncbi:MAG TPA: biotin--[acetyl-CoA-carboxylase] ligase [Actinomycetota bacterium]|nr:biotin--[acetyl-CoA-carboxylase] ligase [Actinomycetota bacterium]